MLDHPAAQGHSSRRCSRQGCRPAPCPGGHCPTCGSSSAAISQGVSLATAGVGGAGGSAGGGIGAGVQVPARPVAASARRGQRCVGGFVVARVGGRCIRSIRMPTPAGSISSSGPSGLTVSSSGSSSSGSSPSSTSSSPARPARGRRPRADPAKYRRPGSAGRRVHRQAVVPARQDRPRSRAVRRPDRQVPARETERAPWRARWERVRATARGIGIAGGGPAGAAGAGAVGGRHARCGGRCAHHGRRIRRDPAADRAGSSGAQVPAAARRRRPGRPQIAGHLEYHRELRGQPGRRGVVGGGHRRGSGAHRGEPIRANIVVDERLYLLVDQLAGHRTITRPGGDGLRRGQPVGALVPAGGRR